MCFLHKQKEWHDSGERHFKRSIQMFKKKSGQLSGRKMKDRKGFRARNKILGVQGKREGELRERLRDSTCTGTSENSMVF